MDTIKKLLLFLTLLNWLCACSSLHTKKPDPQEKPWLTPGVLTSERIEKKFGSFAVDVMFQDTLSGIRLSNLYSTETSKNQKLTRALALVRFELIMDKSLQDAHKEILAGASIGSTLVKHGFLLQKNILYKNTVRELPANVNQMMHTNANDFASIVYELTASLDGVSHPYCTITEIYSPDFLSLNDLNQLYGLENKNPHGAVSEKLEIDAPSEKIGDNFELVRAALTSH